MTVFKWMESSLNAKNTDMRKLESEESRLKEVVKEMKQENKTLFDKQLELARVLKKTVENCALLEAENKSLKDQIKNINLVVPDTLDMKMNNEDRVKKEDIVVYPKCKVKNSWNLPDGSVRYEYENGSIETVYVNGNTQKFDPNNGKTTYFFKDKSLEITKDFCI